MSSSEFRGHRELAILDVIVCPWKKVCEMKWGDHELLSVVMKRKKQYCTLGHDVKRPVFFGEKQLYRLEDDRV